MLNLLQCMFSVYGECCRDFPVISARCRKSMEVLHSVINLLYVCCKSTGMLQVYVYVHSAINLLKYMGMLQGFPCESVHPATSMGWSEGAGGLCSQAERSRGVQQEPCLAQEGRCGHPHQVSHSAPYCFAWVFLHHARVFPNSNLTMVFCCFVFYRVLHSVISSAQVIYFTARN